MSEEEFEIDIFGDDYYNDHMKRDATSTNTLTNQKASKEHTKAILANTHESQGHSKSEERTPLMGQGVKRKNEIDGRPVDPGATIALMISDLNWWATDDDIRGWAQQAYCGDEIKEITFSEHKVNGKSKGQAYVGFISQQAATATKRFLEELEGNSQNQKRPTVVYTNPLHNPFKSVPKDAPSRTHKDNPGGRGGLPSYTERGGNNNVPITFTPNVFRQRGGYSGYRGNFPGPPTSYNNRNLAVGTNHSGCQQFNNSRNNITSFNGVVGNPTVGYNFDATPGVGIVSRGSAGIMARGHRGGNLGNIMATGNPVPMGSMMVPGNIIGTTNIQGFSGVPQNFGTTFFRGDMNTHPNKRPRSE